MRIERDLICPWWLSKTGLWLSYTFSCIVETLTELHVVTQATVLRSNTTIDQWSHLQSYLHNMQNIFFRGIIKILCIHIESNWKGFVYKWSDSAVYQMGDRLCWLCLCQQYYKVRPQRNVCAWGCRGAQTDAEVWNWSLINVFTS